MPKSSKTKLAYQAEYNNRPDQVKKQSMRRAAQRASIKAGGSIGDGKDVAHKVALDNGGTNAKGNTKLQEPSANRAWRKGQKGYKVPNAS